MQLTQREEQIIQLVIRGFKTRLIAKELGLSEHTVKNYLFKVYERHNIHSRTVAAVLYLKNQNSSLVLT